MAKRTASRSTQFFCTQHPLATTHNTVDCRTLKVQKKGNDDSKKTKENKGKKDKHKQKVNATDESDPESGSSDEERVMLAHAARLASPPHTRPQHSHADTTWNPDSGATSHMTPHQEWICNMKTCK
ncbi:hypothetical protein K439DRAFT_1662629 [Ramaria rubella]|nr:hypothetical protein K439DRAFT_1662629 [Ramaria rubella]